MNKNAYYKLMKLAAKPEEQQSKNKPYKPGKPRGFSGHVGSQILGTFFNPAVLSILGAMAGAGFNFYQHGDPLYAADPIGLGASVGLGAGIVGNTVGLGTGLGSWARTPEEQAQHRDKGVSQSLKNILIPGYGSHNLTRSTAGLVNDVYDRIVR